MQQPLDHRDGDRNEQDDYQDVVELLQQPTPPRRFGRALEPVWAELFEAPLRLGVNSNPRTVSERSALTTTSTGSR